MNTSGATDIIIPIILFVTLIVIIAVTLYNLIKTSNKLELMQEQKNRIEQDLNVEKMKNKIEFENLKNKQEALRVETENFNRSLSNFEEEKKQFDLRQERTEIKNAEKESKLDQTREKLESRKESLEYQKEELKTKTELMELELHKKLLEISNLSEKEAQNKLFEDLQERKENEYVAIIKEYKSSLELEKNQISRDILLNAMENIVVDTTNDTVLKPIKIPSEDIKGRLIGREGRNIKTIETLLGVNLIIDDTPGVISISTFNPVRRAIANLALTNLIESGKINQISIEEEAKKAEIEIEEVILERGKEAIYAFNIQDFDIELVKILGQLHYRTSYGQNVLKHSVEAAKIAQHLASELKLDPQIAARCVLLHDIGKVDSQQTGRSHVDLGVLIANKYNESDIVVNAIEAHHGDVEPNNLYSIITIIADKMSAGRNGARRDNFEMFIERIETLEKIALDVKGVSKAYALQGGRELRVIVESSQVSDDRMALIAENVKQKIESDVIFPGVIKVNVIKEARVMLEASKENIMLQGEINE